MSVVFVVRSRIAHPGSVGGPPKYAQKKGSIRGPWRLDEIVYLARHTSAVHWSIARDTAVARFA